MVNSSSCGRFFLARNHHIASSEEWIEARSQLLIKEKEFTRMRDELSRQRRDLPWEAVRKEYIFEGPNGKRSLAEVFDGSQLIIYHFMFGPDWDAGCKACSFWADNFNGIIVHLHHRDVTMLAVSGAPFHKLSAYKTDGLEFHVDFIVQNRLQFRLPCVVYARRGGQEARVVQLHRTRSRQFRTRRG